MQFSPFRDLVMGELANVERFPLPRSRLHVNIFLSNVLTREEGVFLALLTIVGVLWSLVLLISAFMIFHEYEFGRAVCALILTVVGMLICVALLFLLYSLAQQFISTILTVFNEMIFRMRE
jgi:hypothetical protein